MSTTRSLDEIQTEAGHVSDESNDPDRSKRLRELAREYASAGGCPEEFEKRYFRSLFDLKVAERATDALKRDDDYREVLPLLLPLPRQQQERLLKVIADRTGASVRDSVKPDFRDLVGAEEKSAKEAQLEAKPEVRLKIDAPTLDDTVGHRNYLPVCVHAIVEALAADNGCALDDIDNLLAEIGVRATREDHGAEFQFARDWAARTTMAYLQLNEAVTRCGRDGQVVIGYDSSISQRIGKLEDADQDTPFKKICPTIIPDAQGGKRDGNGWVLRLKAKNPEGQFVDICISYVDLATCNVKPLAEKGIKLTQRDAQIVFELLMKVEPPVLRLVEAPGWQGDAYDLFVWGTEALSADGTSSEVIVPFGAKRTSKGSLEAWKTQVAARALGNHCYAAAMLSSLMAPAKRIVGIQSGGENLYADTRNGKTTGGYMGLSVWEHSDGKITYMSTAAGMERRLVATNDRFLLLDGTERGDPERVRDYQYLVGDGATKEMASGKSERDTREPIPFLVEAYSTGEKSNAALYREARIDVKGGAESRMANIPHEKSVAHYECGHDGALFARKILDACKNNYGMAGEAVVRLLMKPEVRVALLKRVEVLRALFLVTNDAMDGQEEGFAYRCALKVSMGEACIDARILPWPREYPLQAVQDEHRRWLAGRGGHGTTVALDAIGCALSYIQTYPNRFQDRDKDGGVDECRIMPEHNGYRKSARYKDTDFYEIIIPATNQIALSKVFGNGEYQAAVAELEKRTLAAIERCREDDFEWPGLMILTPKTSKVFNGKPAAKADKGQQIKRWGKRSYVLLIPMDGKDAEREERKAKGAADLDTAGQNLRGDDISDARPDNDNGAAAAA